MPTTAPATDTAKPSFMLPILEGRANSAGYGSRPEGPDTIAIELPTGSWMRIRANDTTGRFECMAFIDGKDLDAYNASWACTGRALPPVALDDDMGTTLLKMIRGTLASVAWQLAQ